MLSKIKQFFDQQLLPTEDQPTGENPIVLAATTLLIELSIADFDQSEEERQVIQAALKKRFAVTDRQLDELISLAETQQQAATSLYEFTSLINQHYAPDQKFLLIKTMWEVAIADGNISKYEDHLIRKVADLIYLPHSEFIRAKLEVMPT